MAFKIAEPCHEDWSKMTSTEKGAFCQKCSLEVVDFTGKSPFEIKELLIQEVANKQRTCGRITNYQLDQLNDDFFQWKNDSERFRAIWVFSLIAVFGLGLFSCQNTLSKELVTQLNTETAVLLAQDSIQMDSLSSPEKTDSITLATEVLPFAINPYQPEIYYQGIMPDYNWGFKIPNIQCFDINLGTIVQTGQFGIDTVAITHLKQKKINAKKLDFSKTNANLKQNVPLQKQPRTSKQATIEGVLDSGFKYFDSFISPNPITAESKLFLTVHKALTIQLDVYLEHEPTVHRTATNYFEAGNYEIELKFHLYKKGTHQLLLQAKEQVSVLSFVV
jgi:hypothetical protein